MSPPESWRCKVDPDLSDASPVCENNDDAQKTNLVVGVLDSTTTKDNPLDPATVTVELKSLLSDGSVIPLTKQSKDTVGGGVFFRYEDIPVGWYEVRATRTTATGTRERIEQVHVVKASPPMKPSDEHHAVTIVLEAAFAPTMDYVTALKKAVEALRYCTFKARSETGAMFDGDNWDAVPVSDPDIKFELQIKVSVLAADAVAAIIDKHDRWTFDCGEFSQVCQMFARMHSVGPTAYNLEAGRLRLKLIHSDGRGVFAEYARFRTTTGPSPYETALRRMPLLDAYLDVDQGLDEAPIGSTVTWSKPDETEELWKNENTLKLGTDEFHAHGLSRKSLTRAALEAEYRASSTPGDVYVTRVEFVSHRGRKR